MIINHNLPALNTYNRISKNQKALTKSLEKLSSGLRINKAGDDAAGLAISEKMRGQIRGLNQASRNAQDAISLIQTSEGALQETHSLVQRMRELAVQAANDSNTEADREEIQKEINQLTGEVTRIGNATEFNTLKLLNDSTVNGADAEKLVSYLKKWWLSEAESRISSEYGLSLPSNTNLKVIFADDLGSAAALVRGSYLVDPTSPTGITGKGMNLELHIDLSDSGPVSGDNPGSFPQYVDRVIAHEMVHAVMASTMNFGELPTWFKEGAAEFIHGADERLKYTIHNNGGGDTGLSTIMNSINTAWSGSQEDYSVSYVAIRYMHEQIKAGGGDGIRDVLSYLSSNQNDNLEDALTALKSDGKTNFGTSSEFITAFQQDIRTVADLGSVAKIDLQGVSIPEIDTGAIGGLDADGGAANTAESIIPDDEDATEIEQPYSGFTISWPSTDDKGTLNMQVGANTGQSIAIAIKDMRSRALGIAGDSGQQPSESSANYSTKNKTDFADYALDVTTHAKATAAIKVYDEAIEKVSSYRSQLGALQNRLEYTIENLNNSNNNLTAAESRIRDVDLAQEMMQFTKENILGQAAQAMLGQANQMPQRVLQLLG